MQIDWKKYGVDAPEKMPPAEKKDFKFEVKSYQEDDEFFYFSGYLSVYGNVDRGGDIVEKGAFTESLKQHEPILFWMHKSDEPLGVFPKIEDTDKGLYVEGKMPKDDKFVSERIWPQIKVGSIKSMSIGYSTIKERMDGDVRRLEKLFLWEGSLVTIPMNDRANLGAKAAVPYQDGVSFAERSRPWDKESAAGRVRDWAGVEDGGLEDPEVQAKYKRAFLWFDDEDPDLLGSYKLQIADIIDGQLKIVPRAIFAAAAALSGARGGVYIPSEDRPAVIRTVEKYYEKMGIESPFNQSKSFRLDDFHLDDRILEKLFCLGVALSRKNSKALVSFIKSGIAGDGTHPKRDASGEDNGWENVLEEIKSFTKTMEK